MGNSTTRRNSLGLDEGRDRLILVADDKLHPEPLGLLKQSGGVVMKQRVVTKISQAVPVDDHTIDAGHSHR